jgi:subtilisin family serine protease
MARPRQPAPGSGTAIIQEHRTARIAQRADVQLTEGERPHLHVPRELLVARDDLLVVERELREVGARELEVVEPLADRLARFEVPTEEPLAEVVARLRGRGVDRAVRVAPHHVLAGVPYIQGGPAGFPLAADDRLEYSAGAGDGVRVAVLDTGFTPRLHPWLDAHTEAAPNTVEETDVHPRNGWLDDESGHGTFIAGLVLAQAPNATIQIAKVLDSEGYGSELDVARAIVEHAEANIINLSLGCYSHDDLPPLALTEALRHVAPTSVVVAAAGNDATHRPLWPAAHKRVIAVAAVDDAKRRAAFSNFGWWVDAAVAGVDVLSTFLEFEETGGIPAVARRVPQRFRGWARWSGTSFAAPKLAGRIAATMTRDRLANAREAAAFVLTTPGRPIDPDLGVVLEI